MTPPHKGRVAHFLGVAFHRTETFIYDAVAAEREYQNWVVARERAHADSFPWPRVLIDSPRRSRWNPRDWRDGLLNRLHRDPWRRTLRMLRRLRPRLIHAHFGANGWQALSLRRRLGLPLVTSFYGYDASAAPQDPRWQARYAELFAESDAFVAEGPAMKRRLEALGAAPEKVFLRPLTIHLDRYHYRPRSLPQGKSLQLLFVGRFADKKGLPVLLRGVAAAAPSLGPFELRIVGDGPMRDELTALADSLGIGSQVSFLGGLPRGEMIAELDRADLLLAPSRTAADGDSEGGAPTVLLEAQASGLPIVSTTHADIPFVCAPCYAEFLAEEGSSGSFADKLSAMWAAAPRWPEFSQSAREHVAAQHGVDGDNVLESIYDRVAA